MVGTALRAFAHPTHYSLLTIRYSLPLPQLPACRDWQHADDLIAANHHDLVHQVDDDADVIGHDPHHVADIRPGVAAREVEEAVLLGETRDPRFRMFEDQAVTVEPAGIRCQRLRAGVEDAALRRGAAH